MRTMKVQVFSLHDKVDCRNHSRIRITDAKWLNFFYSTKTCVKSLNSILSQKKKICGINIVTQIKYKGVIINDKKNCFKIYEEKA